MKRELFEPFHIGSKFKSHVRNVDILRAFYKHFSENIDQDFEDFELNEDILTKEVLMSPFLTIITKKKKENQKQENLKIQLNLSTNALNVIGDIPANVFDLFKKMSNLLPTLGFELESTFLFYEVINKNVIILNKDDKKPIDIFKRISEKRFQNIENVPDLNVSYIRFSKELVTKENELFNIEILPNHTSPDTRLFLNILKRTEDHQDLINFQEIYESALNEICKRLVE